MFFTVSTLSNENVSSLRKETLVNGGELEHCAHNTAKIKDRLSLDGTQSNAVSSMFKMRNAQNTFNQNNPVQNAQQSTTPNHNQSQNLDQILLNHNQLRPFMPNKLSQNSLNNGDNSKSSKFHCV